jgi:hypothetical protein
MRKAKRNLDTLEGVLKEARSMLTQGATRFNHPFHWPVLGSTGKDGSSLRTVILRQFIWPERMLICHTDARAAKVQEITNFSEISWLFYHPKKKVQLRISGPATLHTYDQIADRQWARTKITSRLNYCASQPPGTPIDEPSSGLPDFLRQKVPSLLESETGRKHFMVIAGRIVSLDWLVLRVLGNRRARFDWDENGLHANWLVP